MHKSYRDCVMAGLAIPFLSIRYTYSWPRTIRSPPTLHGVHSMHREPIDHKHLPQILRDAIDFQFMTEQDSPAKCNMSCDGQTRELRPERSSTLIRTEIEDLAEELQFMINLFVHPLRVDLYASNVLLFEGTNHPAFTKALIRLFSYLAAHLGYQPEVVDVGANIGYISALSDDRRKGHCDRTDRLPRHAL